MPYFESSKYRQQVANPSQASIAASVTSWSRVSPRARSDFLADEEWQQRVRLYDRNGPGIVGAALDMPAATSMLLELCVRKRTASGYEVIKDDPVLAALLGMWRGETLDQRHLFSRLLRTLDAVAECYLIMHGADQPGRLRWQLAQTSNLVDNRDGTATVRKRRGARRGEEWHAVVPDRFIHHAMNSDLEWEGEPWSPLRRALPSIEQYRLVMRNIGRNLRSQLAMNGVMWAQAVGAATDWPDVMKAWSQRAISDDDSIEATMSFPMSTASEPKWIETGRSDHKDQIAVAELFLKAFAQTSDLPTNMLLEGPGQGNHWNAYLEGDFYADMTMAPRWQRACRVITETHLRPLLRGLPSAAGYNPDDYEVWCDDTRIRTKTDNTDRIVHAYERGVANREAFAEAVGLTPDQMLELPEGLSDFEAWLVSRAPASLATRDRGLPGAQGLIDENPGENDTRLPSLNQIVPGVTTDPPEEPDRDEAEARQVTARRRGITAQAGVLEREVQAARAEIESELGAFKPHYWDDLVPT